MRRFSPKRLFLPQAGVSRRRNTQAQPTSNRRRCEWPTMFGPDRRELLPAMSVDRMGLPGQLLYCDAIGGLGQCGWHGGMWVLVVIMDCITRGENT